MGRVGSSLTHRLSSDAPAPPCVLRSSHGLVVCVRPSESSAEAFGHRPAGNGGRRWHQGCERGQASQIPPRCRRAGRGMRRQGGTGLRVQGVALFLGQCSSREGVRGPLPSSPGSLTPCDFTAEVRAERKGCPGVVLWGRRGYAPPPVASTPPPPKWQVCRGGLYGFASSGLARQGVPHALGSPHSGSAGLTPSKCCAMRRARRRHVRGAGMLALGLGSCWPCAVLGGSCRGAGGHRGGGRARSLYATPLSPPSPPGF